MAAATTVLLSVAAASIAYALTRQVVASTRSTATRVDSSNAQAAANETLARVTASLQANPSAFLTEVLPQERARVCLLGPHANEVFEPSQDFPASCGSVWSYRAPSNPLATAVELTAPSVADSSLRVKVLARSGALDDGVQAEFRMAGGRRWVWASTGVLDLSSVSPSSGAKIDGGAYATSGVSGPPNAALTVADGSVLASDTAQPVVQGIPGVRWFGPSPDLSSVPQVESVSRVQRAQLSAGSLASTAQVLLNAACNDAPPALYEDAALPYGSGLGGAASQLCLRAGEVLPTSSWSAASPQTVTVPSGVTAYMLLTDSPSAGSVKVYSTTAELDLSSTSPLLCSPRPTCAAALMNAGSHPGQASFWATGEASLLGTFKLPASGVVFADADVYLGVCSSARNEYALSEVCSVQSGDEPGMTISSPLSVVAGTLADPHDVIINSTIHVRSPGALAAVATDRVVFPYWLSGRGSQAVVATHLLGVGLNSSGSSSATFPATAAEADRFASLVVNGSLIGRDITLGNGLASSVTYKHSPDSRNGAPWFGGTDASWSLVRKTRFSGVDACGSRKCSGWTANEPTITPVNPDRPGTAQLPSAPVSVTAQPAWASGSSAQVSFGTPATSGSSAIDSYRAVCSSSSSNGVRRVASGLRSPLTVAGLTPNQPYSCTVEAHNNEGYSDLSTPSATFESFGVPLSPTITGVSSEWDGSTVTATVVFSQPTGGLAPDSFTTTCYTQDGTDSASAQGPSPATVVGLIKDQRYACVVRGTNVAGVSGPSQQSDWFETSGPPDAPTVSAVDGVVGGLRVWWGSLSTGGSPVTNLQARWSSDSGSTWASASGLPTTAPYTISGLSSGSTYVVQLRAVNALGSSGWSASSDPTTVPTVPTAPAQPACQDGPARTVLTWSAPSSTGGVPVTSYRYRVSQDSGASWSSPASGVSPLTVVGLVNATSYLFQVAAVNDVGAGAWSASSDPCVPFDVPSVPARPSVSAGASSVTVSWTAPSANGRPITSYVVRVTQTGDQCVTAATSCVVTGLANGTAYTFSVQAVNAAGGSGWSLESPDATPYGAMLTTRHRSISGAFSTPPRKTRPTAVRYALARASNSGYGTLGP